MIRFAYVTRNLTFVVALAATLTACSLPATGNNTRFKNCNAGAIMASSTAGLDQVTLCIESKGKVQGFTAEVAQTGQQQQQGLMFRTKLADNAGMIFPFEFPRIASFWMKNTVIPLDIIFIKADGKIENIAENTIPYSTDPVSATAPVTAVLELRAGLTRELGIGPGDTVVWKNN
jgi:uncharacterized protein